jgi:hypothetical protein
VFPVEKEPYCSPVTKILFKINVSIFSKILLINLDENFFFDRKDIPAMSDAVLHKLQSKVPNDGRVRELS